MDLGRLGLQGHQTGRSVCKDVEVRSGWGTHGCGSALRVNLVIDEAPLLQEGVHSAAEETHSVQHRMQFNQIKQLSKYSQNAGVHSHSPSNYLMIAHTSPARFLRQAVDVRYS